MLAARLGVALIVVLILSSVISSRDFSGGSGITPKVHISADSDDHEPKVVRIGGIDFSPDSDDREEIDRKLRGRNAQELEEINEALAELEAHGKWGEVLSAGLQAALKDEIAQYEAEREEALKEQEAMKAAGAEIAEAFSMGEESEPSVADGADRLSEDEIQSLVVERLLSVQTQMREDGSDSDTGSASAPTASASETDANSAGESEVSELAAPAVPTIEEAAPDPQPAPPVRPLSPDELAALPRLEGEFAGQNLMGTDFRNRDLSEVDFSNAKLTAAKFDGSNLEGADFEGARLQGASFTGAVLTDANLANAQAQTARFVNADLTDADLTQANLAGADLTNADLRGATMDEVNLNGAVLNDTKMGE